MRSLVDVELASLDGMVQAPGDPDAGRVRLVDVTTTPGRGDPRRPRARAS